MSKIWLSSSCSLIITIISIKDDMNGLGIKEVITIKKVKRIENCFWSIIKILNS